MLILTTPKSLFQSLDNSILGAMKIVYCNQTN